MRWTGPQPWPVASLLVVLSHEGKVWCMLKWAHHVFLSRLTEGGLSVGFLNGTCLVIVIGSIFLLMFDFECIQL